MPITHILTGNAEKYANQVCLTEINPEFEDKREVNWKELALVESAHTTRYRRVMTWRDFDDKANQFAHLLMEKGVRRGHKVGILLMNCLEWLPIYFGALKTGGLAVPLNFRYSADEILYALGLADVSVLVFGPEFIDRVNTIRDRIPMVHTLLFVGDNQPDFALSYDLLAEAQPKHAPDIAVTDEEDAAIYFSSGTTGFPKAILHTHLSLVTACIVEQNHHGQTRDDIFLCIPPLYHTGAKMHWFGSLLVGGSGVLLRGIRPRWILETAANEHATIVWLLVPWAQDILDAIDSGEINPADYDLSAWRLMHIGAQPVPPSLVRRWKKLFPHHDYDTNYGLSESNGPGAVHLGIENLHKVGAIGKPGFGWQARIVDENGVDVTPGDVGELILKGDSVMKCYYKDPDATAAAIKDGWLYTGDMARVDEDGFIFLVDRKKDVIITGGENIYPVQIEDFLRGHDKIKDVAVIGMADNRLGEISAAIIEIKPNMTCDEEEIRQFCTQLPRYKRPYVIVFDAVPRNATGKIEKPKLRARYSGGSLVQKQTEQ